MAALRARYGRYAGSLWPFCRRAMAFMTVGPTAAGLAAVGPPGPPGHRTRTLYERRVCCRPGDARPVMRSARWPSRTRTSNNIHVQSVCLRGQSREVPRRRPARAVGKWDQDQTYRRRVAENGAVGPKRVGRTGTKRSNIQRPAIGSRGSWAMPYRGLCRLCGA